MRRLFPLLLLTACGPNSLTIEMVEQNNSGQNGTATLTDSAGHLDIVVTIKKSSVAGSQNSHIHQGRCDNVGPIEGALAMMPLQVSFKDGGASEEGDNIVFKATLNTTLAQVRDMNHVINVHDARDNSLYVSCGEIN